MKTTNLVIITAATITLLGWTTACQTAATSKSVIFTEPVKTMTNTPTPEATKTETIEPSAGSFSTPTETYKTAFAARQKRI
jgi:hypothetical protein